MNLIDLLPESLPWSCDQCGTHEYASWIEGWGCDRCRGKDDMELAMAALLSDPEDRN